MFLTGDYIHSGVWLYGKRENRRHITRVMQMALEKFPNSTIYPITGNHEPHVVNMYVPNDLWKYVEEGELPDTFSLAWLYEAVMGPFLDAGRLPNVPQDEINRFMKVHVFKGVCYFVVDRFHVLNLFNKNIFIGWLLHCETGK